MLRATKLKKLTSAGSISRINKKLTGTDLLMRHHNYGVGRVLSKKSWQKHSPAGDLSDCHWLITRVSPKKIGNFGNSMKAWGILTWKGKLYHNGEERRVKGVNSAGWKMIEDNLVYEQQKHSTLSPDLHAAWLLENAPKDAASKAAL